MPRYATETVCTEILSTMTTPAIKATVLAFATAEGVSQSKAVHLILKKALSK